MISGLEDPETGGFSMTTTHRVERGASGGEAVGTSATDGGEIEEDEAAEEIVVRALLASRGKGMEEERAFLKETVALAAGRRVSAGRRAGGQVTWMGPADGRRRRDMSAVATAAAAAP